MQYSIRQLACEGAAETKACGTLSLRNILFVDRPSKFLFLFLNSDTVLSDSVQKFSPAFDKLNEIE